MLPSLQVVRQAYAEVCAFLVLAQYHLAVRRVALACELVGGVKQVAGFQVDGEVLAYLCRSYEVERRYSVLHDVLVTFGADCVDAVAEVVEYQRTCERIAAFAEEVGQVGVDEPRGGTFEL